MSRCAAERLLSLLCDLLRQRFDFLFHLLVHGLQGAPSIRGMGSNGKKAIFACPS
jgi:hypothetical protein